MAIFSAGIGALYFTIIGIAVWHHLTAAREPEAQDKIVHHGGVK